MYKCDKGFDTTNNPASFTAQEFCFCEQSCEPHKHDQYPYNMILCMHDGETDHVHCPQSPWAPNVTNSQGMVD